MNLHKKNALNNFAKKVASPLSGVIIGFPALTKVTRAVIAYLNYLIGQGAGLGGSGDIDNEAQAAAKKVYRREPIIFDVGGNVGIWTSQIKNLCSDAYIHIFEPQEDCLKAIHKRNFKNVKIHECAVGREAGELELFSSGEHDGTASFHERKDSYFSDRTYTKRLVPVITLDQLVEQESLTFIDFIKFDIEGHEFEALRGLKTSLESTKIGAFSFEVGSGCLNARTCLRDFWNLLSDRYFFEIITPGGKLRRIDSYYEDLEYFRGVTNYVATLKNHPFRN